MNAPKKTKKPSGKSSERGKKNQMAIGETVTESPDPTPSNEEVLAVIPEEEALATSPESAATAPEENPLVLYGSHESVQALMCGETILKSAFDDGPYRLTLYPEAGKESVLDIFDIEKIECDEKQFEMAKSKIINSSFSDNCTPKDMFLMDRDFWTTPHGKPSKDFPEGGNRTRHDKLNGIKFAWILTNWELVHGVHGWEFTDNVIESVWSFFRKLYPRAVVDEATEAAVLRKFEGDAEKYGYSKIAELKPKEDLLRTFLEGLSDAVSGTESDDPFVRFANVALDSEFDAKKMTNSQFIQNLFDEAFRSAPSNPLAWALKGLCSNIFRDGGFMEFSEAKNPWARGYVEIIFKRLLYATMYGFSSMQWSLKSQIFEMGGRREVSQYFWSDWGSGFTVAYRENDGEGNGVFGTCVRLIRKTDWKLGEHYSDDLPEIARELMFQKESVDVANASLRAELAATKNRNASLENEIADLRDRMETALRERDEAIRQRDFEKRKFEELGQSRIELRKLLESMKKDMEVLERRLDEDFPVNQ